MRVPIKAERKKAMNSKNLAAILKDHRECNGGKRANLCGSDLRDSDLRRSDLRGSNLSGSDFEGSDLSGSYLSGSDLRGSNLRNSNLMHSDLSGSDLSGSDLRGSNLDFSCWPLWCGTKGVILDDNQKDQLKLHLYWVLGDDDPVKAQIKEAAKRAADKRNIALD